MLNGLLVQSDLRIDKYLDKLNKGLKAGRPTLAAVTENALLLFPEKMPAFLHYADGFLGNEVVDDLAFWNIKNDKYVTVWEILTGSRSVDADQYRQTVEGWNRKHFQGVEPIEITEQIYGWLRGHFIGEHVDAAMLANLAEVETIFPEYAQVTRHWINDLKRRPDDLMLAMESMIIRRLWFEVRNEYRSMIQRPQDFPGVTALDISFARTKLPILQSLFDAFNQRSRDLVSPLRDRANMESLQGKVKSVFQAYGFLLASVAFGHLRGITDFTVNNKPWNEGIFDEYLSDPNNWDKPASVELKGEETTNHKS